jgi:hypothetical protein
MSPRINMFSIPNIPSEKTSLSDRAGACLHLLNARPHNRQEGLIKMIIKKPIISLLIVFTLVLTAGSALAASMDLVKDMAAIDRVFIPCLSLTNMNKVGPATKAVTELKKLWADFSSRHAKAMPGDSDWTGDLEMAAEAIAEAHEAISQSKDSEGAHHSLEEVRFIMLQMRIRNNVPYYLDYLNQYHEVMEPLIHGAAEKAPSAWSTGDVQNLQNNAAEALTAWNLAAQAKLDPAIWDLKPGQVKKLKEAYAQGGHNLSTLVEALNNGDKQTAAKALKKVKPYYSKCFKLFGDVKRFMN